MRGELELLPDVFEEDRGDFVGEGGVGGSEELAEELDAANSSKGWRQGGQSGLFKPSEAVMSEEVRSIAFGK